MIQVMTIFKKNLPNPDFFSYTSIDKLGVGKKNNSGVKLVSLRNEQLYVLWHNKHSTIKINSSWFYFF